MKKFRYPLMIIASAIMFGVAPALTRITYDYGGNGISIPFYMSIISMPIFYLMMRREGTPAKVEKKILKQLALVSVLGSTTAAMLLMYSYALIPVGMATTLHFVYPVIIAFGLVIFFKEKLNAWKVTALAVAVAGIAVMSLDSVDVNLPGIIIALLSGVFWAFYIVYLDKSGLSNRSAYQNGFYISIFSLVQTGIVGAATGNLQLLTSPKAWAYLLGATMLARVFGQIFFQIGISGAGSLAAGILSTFEPITSVVIGILLLGEESSIGKIVGCLLVIVGVCLIVYSDYQEEQKKAVEAKTQGASEEGKTAL